MTKKIINMTLCGLLLCFSVNAFAQKNFKIAWSHYTGWEPWGYMQDSGILKKWGKKFNINIEAVLINDYIESINLYTLGKFDACTMTNMDVLTIPSSSGIDSTALIIGDFSNGNDGIVAKTAKNIKQLKGKDVYLVELSVSHYLLTRALEQNHMREKDLNLINTSDADIATVFMNSSKNSAVVTWNPPLQVVKQEKGTKLLFDSSNIPGEIIDLLVVNSKTPDSFKKAVIGAWYETMNLLKNSPQRNKIVKILANQSGTNSALFEKQLKTTAMFFQKNKADAFANSTKLKTTMRHVRNFVFDKGLMGNGINSPGAIGIMFPDKTVLGDPLNIKLRF